MEFLDPAIEEYALAHSQQEPEVLQQLARETWTKVLQPRMLSGHLQGRLLSMISKMLSPTCILEIGTYTAYSAICLAEGIKKGGHLHTIDINEELRDINEKYVKLAGMEDVIQLHYGPALKIIPELNLSIDLVFIDADKENYSNYFDAVIDNIQSGGIIIADNVLWSGKVLDTNETTDSETSSLMAYSQKVSKDPRVESLLLPVRDGLMISRKK